MQFHAQEHGAALAPPSPSRGLVPVHRPGRSVLFGRGPRAAAALLLAAAVAGGVVHSASAATVFMVNTAADADDGACTAAHCTLREAINAANAASTPSVIAFAIAGAGPHTIKLSAPLPPVQRTVIIDGFTQPGAAANTNGPGLGSNAAIKVRLDGSAVPEPASGLTIAAADSVVRGLSITGFRGGGLRVVAPGVVIAGNYIGVDPSGAVEAGNVGHGVHLAANNGTVGGPLPAARNVIAGNKGAGVLVDSGTTGNQVLGNLIGVRADGAAAMPNSSHGVNLQGVGNAVGGTTPAARNVISGNNGSGVLIAFGASNAVVQGNYIGLNAAGTAAVPNVTHGVVVDGSNNTVGGVAAGAGNVISGNLGTGVLVPLETSGARVQGNLIGTNAAGTAAIPNERHGLTVFGPGNLIGGTEPGARNVISGNNRDGVILTRRATKNVVQGNYLGLGANGAAVPNARDGVEVWGVGNMIGGAVPGAGNVISGNAQNGVELACDATLNAVQGNLVGTDPAGNAAVGNRGFGVLVQGPRNMVGGPGAGGNVISGNQRDGLNLSCKANEVGVLGNRIGTNAAGTAAVPNRGSGVLVEVSGAVIGAGSLADRNVISGNGTHGVYVPAGVAGVWVISNYIGLNAEGTGKVPNGGNGVLVHGNGAIVGAGGLGNVISGNAANGVELGAGASGAMVKGNLIGTNAAGGGAVPNGTNGVIVMGAGNLVGGAAAADRNVVAGNTHHGVVVAGGATGNRLEGNYLGVTPTGAALGNGYNGVAVQGDDNVIGGAAAGAGNVISGNNQNGVFLEGTANRNLLLGNLIGLAPDGATPLGNRSNGVFVAGSENTIGAGNAIAGNLQNGVVVAPTALATRVQGSAIGTNAGGAAPLGNQANGLVLQSTGALVGGADAGQGNTIAFNGKDGLLVDSTSKGNSILGNRFYGNTYMGIALGYDGVTPNDAGDGDSGANNLQNWPVLAAVPAGATALNGTLNSTPNATFRVELFLSAACDSSGAGEGERLLGAVTVTTNPAGDAAFTLGALSPLPAGAYVTGTATSGADGSTSEFSRCVQVK